MKKNYSVMQFQSLCLINQGPMRRFSDYIYFLEAFEDTLTGLRDYSNKTMVKLTTRSNGKYKSFFGITIENKVSL